MKKVLSFALVVMLMLSAVSFAQAKKAAPAKASVSSNAGMSNVSFGFIAGTPTVQYNFTKDFSGQAGLVYTSVGGATNTAFLVEGSYSLMKVGSNDFTLGGIYTSVPGTTTIIFTCGIKANLNSNVELQFLIFPVSIASAGGGSTTTIGGATIGAHLYM